MASTSQEMLSQEQILQLLESNGGEIKDTRTLWQEGGQKPSWQDIEASEQYFQRKAAWQVGLSGVLNSLQSKEVSAEHPI
jgi:hypothetical protein